MLPFCGRRRVPDGHVSLRRRSADPAAAVSSAGAPLPGVWIFVCLQVSCEPTISRVQLTVAMDACARIRGVSVKSRASVRKETVRDGGAQSAKSLFRNKKELCSIALELPGTDTSKLAEVHFVCLPGQCDGEDVTQKALSSLPAGLCELLRSLNVHSLKNDEVLLLKDSRRLAEHRDARPPCWLKALCVLRLNPSTGVYPQATVMSLMGLLGCYMAGVRYVLDLQGLHRGAAEHSHPEEDDTNQSVSSIEDDFVTALEHLEEDDTGENSPAAAYCHFKKRDVASQTIPAHKRKKELSGSRVIVSSSSKKCSGKHRLAPDVSVTVQKSSSGVESQWTYCSPGARLPSPLTHVSESEESDCSSPSPIIFLDEVGYQKSLLAKLDIPQVPGGPRERVEDSDSEVSEFFDSFDQFDDLEELSSESCTLTLPLDPISASNPQKKSADAGSNGSASKYVSRGCSTKVMNPHRFDQPTLPANVKKPTPLKPGSPYSINSEVPDSPRLAHSPSEENGGPLFSPVSSSAFSPLVDSCGSLEYFWKTDEEGEDSSELRKPQDLCSLYKTYSDFASSLSKEILGSVCGYQSAVDISDNKNLSCVCHKEFQNPSGYLMKLSEIQETVTVAKLQKKSHSLKDGIQRFATDLVEMSLGSALRDLQKGVSSCTTTLCHLAARLTSSVFQMAFHEIGMRHALVLKERAVSGLAGFLVGEAISGALKDFLTVKKQIFHSTVTQFAADLAEELVFEGIMEVCQFSHPSTPLTPSDWSFGHGQEEEEEEEEEVVSSYASDLSESVIQEAFIELSQADVAFTSQAAISVSLDNICYVSAENSGARTCSTFANQQLLSASSAAGAPGPSGEDATCTVKNALFTVSGMASCVPVPQAGQALSHFQNTDDICQNKSGLLDSPETSANGVAALSYDSSQTHTYSPGTQTSIPEEEPSQRKSPFQNFSGNMVDMIVSEACELITTSKMKRSFGECADFLTKTIGNRRDSQQESPDSPSKLGAGGESFRYDGCVRQGAPVDQASDVHIPHISFRTGCSNQGRVHCETDHRRRGVVETHPVMMDTLDVPDTAMGGQNRTSIPADDSAPTTGQKSVGTPGTPPSTPQQPSEVSKEKQIKRFSKKLKSKLAKEFSPATPPPTPHYQPEPGPGPKDIIPEADKNEFMLNLMRSLSEEADSAEDVDEEEAVEERGISTTNRCLEGEVGRHDPNQMSSRRMSNKEALHYAERLACHIVSMATEMDTLGVAQEEGEMSNGSERVRDSVAQFSEQTLNTLWVYAGEVAGEVINDVKKMVSSGQQCPYHKGLRRRSFERSSSECLHHFHRHPFQPNTDQNRDWRLRKLAEQWSHDLIASVSQSTTSTSRAISSSSSGLSSEYPSCESVTDEYAGYLIRVLKKEGGSRELVLDQYASRLAYRSIKLGLSHASRKIKKRSSSSQLHSSKSLPDEWKASGSDGVSAKDRAETGVFQSGDHGRCSCTDTGGQSKRGYKDLVNFAESLAYNITCDVTRKLHLSTGRLPKSLTDSCLYKKSKLEDMTENLIRNSFSCPLLSGDKSRHYHSTGSLHDGGYSGRVMQVVEHYARKIADDTLKMSLASVGHSSWEYLRTQGHDRLSHAQRLSEGPSGVQALGERTCRYCLVQECPYCTKHGSHQHQSLLQRRKREPEYQAGAERLSGVEIPKIHIDPDHRAVFAEEMVSMAMETAKRELSNTSLNADSGIGHDGTSYAESLTAEIMTSALSNVCQVTSLSSPGREATESTVSQQLSVGEDSLGSWSNLSFEDDHPDDNSSFLHLSDSDNTEDRETEVKEDSSGTLCVERTPAQPPRTTLLMVNSDVREPGRGPQPVTLDPQLRSMLQWVAASMADVPQIQLSPDRELQQLPVVVQRLRERKWRVGDLLHTLLHYCEEMQTQSPPAAREETLQTGREPHRSPLFQWLLEHA
ncbi:A-kinase anchor protein 11 isoform X3 [Cololabis saira]|uniref:A-kinase anchor protein 11 isoform X3 n=1 Tax=Cololabis saira TaxID=129043 RepID=UPI002AD4DA5B|nr:A-kinase anchor protein 11 isoform X3 [Cololabis saira]